MRSRAYPEIGRGITISQGKGTAASTERRNGRPRRPRFLLGSRPQCFQRVETPFRFMPQKSYIYSLYIKDEHAGGALQKRISWQVSLTVSVEPAVKKPRSRRAHFHRGDYDSRMRFDVVTA